MKEAGWALVAVAALALVGGMMIDVSVATPAVPGGAYTPYVPSQEVANLHKMHIQALVVQGAFVTFLAGIVLVGCGTVAERLGVPRAPEDVANTGLPTGTAAGTDAASHTSEAGDLPTQRAPDAAEEEPPNELAGVVLFVVVVLAAVGVILAIAGAASGGASSRADNVIDLNAIGTDVFNTTDINTLLLDAEEAERAAANALNH
ncbi:MAG TPA: hypothetical protein VGB79_01070 [Allosphingosinicella sp.]|jgi:hypothetical protein